MSNLTNRGGLVVLALTGLMVFGGCTNRLKAERDALYQQNQELQAELDRLRSTGNANDAQVAQLQGEIARLQGELDAARTSAATTPAFGANTGFNSIPGVETSVSNGSVTVRVPGDVLFSSGKVDLKSTAKATLDQIASVIKRDYASNTIRVEGYTDTDPITKSGWKDNLALSSERAMAVVRYLKSQGVSAGQMYAAGFGEHHPRDSKAKSRRVEIVVVLNQ